MKGPFSRTGVATAVVTALLITGCSPYSTGRFKEHLKLPVINGTGAEGAPIYGQTDRWWEEFHDPELDSLMNKAFSHNLDLAQTYERMLQARAAAREAGASRLPTLTANATGGRVRQTTSAGPFEADTHSASLNAQFEIDLWGKMNARAKAAVLESLAAEEALKTSYMGVSVDIAELYYTSVEQKAQLSLSELTIESLNNIKESVELRYRAGVVTALDLYLARQNLATASTKRPALEASLAAAEAGLALALGNIPANVRISTPDTLPEPTAFPGQIPSDLLKRRPDVMAAQRKLEAQDYRVAAAVADRFPAFSLSASYGGASEKLGDVLKSPNIFWNALLNLTMPIIDGGRRKAASEREKAALRESLAAYHKAVLTAMKEVHVALIRNQATREQIRLMEQAVTAGEDTLRVAEAQYLQGVTDYLNVLTAQQQLHSSRSSLLTSRRQLISDRIQLARALGGTWMAHEAGKREQDYPEKAGNDD